MSQVLKKLGVETLEAAWLVAKNQERAARQRRIQIEDEIVARVAPNGVEPGTTKLSSVKFVASETRKTDAHKVAELAQEHGISTEVLNKLFRWKAEYNAAAWKIMGDDRLLPAITRSIGRPSFSAVENKESK